MENHEILDPKIQDEVLRSRIRKFIDAKPSPSFLQRVSTSPLASVITAFVLTGLIGGFLTNYYNGKQKELEAQRTNEQRESDRLSEVQQRESDRKREDDRRESDRIRGDQQRESDRLYQVRQKDIEYRRIVHQRESDRLSDIRQKVLEDQLRIKELIERLDLEIGYRLSQFQIQLSDIADITSIHRRPLPFRAGKGEKEIKEAIASLLQSPKGKFSPLYEEFSNVSTLALIAELRRYVPAKEREELDQVLADLSGIYIYLDVKKVKLTNIYGVAEAIFNGLTLPRWRKSNFYFSDCPFC
jgi:hypothetical protein